MGRCTQLSMSQMGMCVKSLVDSLKGTVVLYLDRSFIFLARRCLGGLDTRAFPEGEDLGTVQEGGVDPKLPGIIPSSAVGGGVLT